VPISYHTGEAFSKLVSMNSNGVVFGAVWADTVKISAEKIPKRAEGMEK
jgi:hypothetical protein